MAQLDKYIDIFLCHVIEYISLQLWALGLAVALCNTVYSGHICAIETRLYMYYIHPYACI